ncbi:MAG: hypothetical protein SF029_13725 [bacterium]|nr:hypothetical protein [bacterium]
MSSEIVIAVFPSRNLLTEALDHVAQLRDIAIKRAAIVAKGADGETVVLDDDLGANEGGIAGGLAGAVLSAFGMIHLGALGLPLLGALLVLLVAVLLGGFVGGVIGLFAATLLDFSFKDTHVETLVQQLQTGRLALVLEVASDHGMLARIREELNLFQAEFLQRGDDLAASAVMG